MQSLSPGRARQFGVGGGDRRHRHSISSPPPRRQRFAPPRARRAGPSAGRRWRRRRTPASSAPPTKPPATAASSPKATQFARSPSAPWPVIRSQTRPSRGVDIAPVPRPRRRQRRRTRRLDDHVGGRQQRAQPRRLVEIRDVGELSAVHPVEERWRARPGAVRAGAALSTLTTVAPGPRQQLPAQRAGPHRRQVGDQQTGTGRGRWWQHRADAPAAARQASRRAPRPAGRAAGPGSVDLGGGAVGGPALRSPATGRRRWRVGLQQRRHGVDVVGPGQRERAPAVAAGHAAASPRPPTPGRGGDQTEQRGPAGEKLVGVDRDTGAAARDASATGRARDSAARGCQRRHSIIVPIRSRADAKVPRHAGLASHFASVHARTAAR